MRDVRAHAGSLIRSTRLARGALAGVVAASIVAPAEAGHELSFYPSFSPQEITIETVAPAVAARRLQDSSLHAYVGADPFAGGAVPNDVAGADSFGSYVVVRIDPAVVKERAERCALADDVRARLASATPDFVVHAHPVTPYHADYLDQFDRAAAATKAIIRHPAGAARPGDAGVTVERIDLATLLASEWSETNGWIGPPWVKAGWYHAYLLEAPTVSDPTSRRLIEATYRRLVSGAYESLRARIELERALVRALGSGCERNVAGYTVKREYTSAEYSQGVENAGWDAQTGLGSAIFVRTVKLKDFPWNGWLRIGTPGAPSAAWNPIGGFTDPAGRLIWAAIGDPALIPAPRSGGWLANRAEATVAARATGDVAVPSDAVRPAPGTGQFTRVGPGRRARTKLVYRVREGAFHDGTAMNLADIRYALGLAFRLGARVSSPEGHDVGVAAATALVRERLVALRVTRIETVVKKDSDVEFIYQVPIVEVYLDHAARDVTELAALAPPWSVVPWHAAALMEEAVTRGVAAFSRDEAERRGVPWLDVVRDARTRDALAGLLDGFEAQGFVPASLRKDVTETEARARWAALKRFYRTTGHFLVTNGPYRLQAWSEGRVTLGVFRDLTYPLGIGHFDEYAIPLRAHVVGLTDRGDRLEFRADVERVSKFARSYEIVREPLGPKQGGGHDHVPSCRYVVLAADGGVVRAGHASYDDRRLFRVDLKGLRPGAYTVLLAFEVDANAVDRPITVAEHPVAAR